MKPLVKKNVYGVMFAGENVSDVNIAAIDLDEALKKAREISGDILGIEFICTLDVE